jgi:hypothetical protein
MISDFVGFGPDQGWLNEIRFPENRFRVEIAKLIRYMFFHQAGQECAKGLASTQAIFPKPALGFMYAERTGLTQG